ncbi:MAG: putative aminopeptidase YsdC [Anaerolineales bacterium]|nr:putative aminopeptidase YsdC [Anaerolineales bacterium]
MTEDILPFLKSLLSAPGLTGHEAPVASLIEAKWKTIADRTQRTRLGSVHALSDGDGFQPRPKLLISAHMDAIGMMVAGVADGFLTLSPVGHVDARVLPSQSVIVHGREPLRGIVVPLPPSFRADPKSAVTFDDLRVDVGLPPKRLAQLVRPGDLISFATEPLEMRGGIISGHSLDNRASIAALTLAMEELQLVRHDWDVWFAATVQEELTYAGGGTSAFALKPDLAIIVDVTFGEDGNGKSHETFPLGGGPTLGVGPTVHPFLLKTLKELAKQIEIPFAIEPMPKESFTEADLIQLTGAGIPTAILSIPLRYMHTPVELVSLADIERAAKLLTAFSAMLTRNFMQTVTWDD